MLGDTRYDRTSAQTIVDTELQQLVGFGHFLTFQHFTHPNIQFHEIVESDILPYRRSLVILQFIGFLRLQQLVHLRLDHAVFYLLEQQLGLTQLGSGRQNIGTSQHIPVTMSQMQHSPQLLGRER